MPKFFTFGDADLSKFPVWLQLRNLPLELWTQKALSLICSKVGKPLYADQLTFSHTRVGYARVLVEVDVAKEVVRQVEIELPDGSIWMQGISFEKLPHYCTLCKKVGHSPVACPVHSAGGKQKNDDLPQGKNEPKMAACAQPATSACEGHEPAAKGSNSAEAAAHPSSNSAEEGHQANTTVKGGKPANSPAMLTQLNNQARRQIPMEQVAATTADSKQQTQDSPAHGLQLPILRKDAPTRKTKHVAAERASRETLSTDFPDAMAASKGKMVQDAAIPDDPTATANFLLVEKRKAKPKIKKKGHDQHKYGGNLEGNTSKNPCQ